jgi:hypothetical protein
MSWATFVASIESAFGTVERVIDKASIFVKETAPEAALVGKIIGNPEVVAAAQAATVLSTGIDNAYQAHQTAVSNGADPNASQLALAANITQVVAASGVIKNSETAAQVSAIASAVVSQTNAPSIGLQG